MKLGAPCLVLGACGTDGAAIGGGDCLRETFVLEHVCGAIEAAKALDSFGMQNGKDGRGRSPHGAAGDEGAPDFASGLHFIENLQ